MGPVSVRYHSGIPDHYEYPHVSGSGTSHPVWGFKNIISCGVGGSGAGWPGDGPSDRIKFNIVVKVVFQTGRALPNLRIPENADPANRKLDSWTCGCLYCLSVMTDDDPS